MAPVALPRSMTASAVALQSSGRSSFKRQTTAMQAARFISTSRTALLSTGLSALRGASLAAPRKTQQGFAVKPLARAKDPDAIDADSKDPNMEPPNLLWRVFAAVMYVIPWIDTLTLGREIFHTFPQTILLYLLPAPFVSIYYANNFMPLIVFFLCFLAIVKNTKLHHFVRFNTMQAIMLDIGVMLFNILRAYFPAEIRWSIIMVLFDKFSFLACMATILYGVFFTLRGFYADIPFVSEAVYIQVEASEYA